MVTGIAFFFARCFCGICQHTCNTYTFNTHVIHTKSTRITCTKSTHNIHTHSAHIIHTHYTYTFNTHTYTFNTHHMHTFNIHIQHDINLFVQCTVAKHSILFKCINYNIYINYNARVNDCIGLFKPNTVHVPDSNESPAAVLTKIVIQGLKYICSSKSRWLKAPLFHSISHNNGFIATSL